MVATVHAVQLTVVDHPLARARLSRMRDERTDNAAFRAALRELTQMLVYEATRELALAEETISTPVVQSTGYRLAAPRHQRRSTRVESSHVVSRRVSRAEAPQLVIQRTQ